MRADNVELARVVAEIRGDPGAVAAVRAFRDHWPCTGTNPLERLLADFCAVVLGKFEE